MKKCPNCDVVMNEVIKVNVLIDVCPKCMGIWLDKGELEKLVSIQNNDSRNYRNDDWDDHHEHHDDDHYNKHSGYKGKGRFGNMLGNLFD